MKLKGRMLLIGSLLLTGAGDLRAQSPCALSARIGVSAPASEPTFGDNRVLDLSAGLGLGLGIACDTSLGVRLGVDADALNLGRLLLVPVLGAVGVRLNLSESERSAWIDVMGRAGITFSADIGTRSAILPDGRAVDSGGAGPVFGGGVRLGFPIGRSTSLYVDASVYRAFLRSKIHPVGDDGGRLGVTAVPMSVGVEFGL